MSGMNPNTSVVQEFIIVGFPGFQDQDSKRIVSGVFLSAYLLILLGNLLIIFIFVKDESLHTPMYMLICSLAILDIILPSVILPKMLVVFMFDSKAISFVACFMQLLFYHGLITSESFLLGLMAYDRYMAICHPLHYPSLMTNTRVLKLIVCCWVGGLCGPILPVILAVRLPFCGPNMVVHCFCDHVSVVRLTCADITINSYVALTISLSTLFIPLTYILFSYIRIIHSVFKIASSEGRLKAFSTCGTHLLVISVFFLNAAGVSISYRVSSTSVDMRIMASVLQSVIPPLMNPIIYCLRTKEIRESFLKTLQRTKILPKR
ncbi:olfactory receptor 6N1-like [Erpetoichthys calabaricus]|uniref:olfactory receptor 6N1-like n=1 Tax=Erpetoichthys calabaricus TaxID=27687 RepID=UPI002234ADC8|nr:olfactory receptor 6N1-like [Erpetoichthys calabaricus]